MVLVKRLGLFVIISSIIDGVPLKQVGSVPMLVVVHVYSVDGYTPIAVNRK